VTERDRLASTFPARALPQHDVHDQVCNENDADEEGELGVVRRERQRYEECKAENSGHQERDDARNGKHRLWFLAEQKIAQAHQLAIGVEAKLDAAAAPRTYDGNVRAETCAQAGFEVELLR
jgi:hypothetical protein